jgi:hypothetical protein
MCIKYYTMIDIKRCYSKLLNKNIKHIKIFFANVAMQDYNVRL